MNNPEDFSSNTRTEDYGNLKRIKEVQDHLTKARIMAEQLEALNHAVTPQIMNEVSGLAVRLHELNHNMVVVSHQGLLSQAAIPTQNFDKSLTYDPAQFLNAKNNESSEKALANTLSEDIVEIDKLNENQFKNLLAHIKKKQETFNQRIDDIRSKQIAETSQILKNFKNESANKPDENRLMKKMGLTNEDKK